MAAPSQDLVTFLREIAIFGGLTDPGLLRVIALLHEEHAPVGATVCREGEMAWSMYVVRSGDVVVCRKAASGALIRVTRLGPGDFFGEMSLIDIQARSATVVVEKPAVLYSLTNRDLFTLYGSDTESYVMVIQNIARELQRGPGRARRRVRRRRDADPVAPLVARRREVTV
jgi:CRP-like cAMP-binding protein